MPRPAMFSGRNSIEILLPLAVFIVALTGRILLLHQYDYPLMLHEQDAAGYMKVARSLLRFSGEDLMVRPPVYPAVIALCSLFTGNFEYAARFASILMDALICFPLYALARIVLSRISAALTAVMWAFFTYSLYFSRAPLSQSTWLFCALAGLWALARALESPQRRYQLLALSGFVFALSYLTRPEGILGFGFGLMVFVATALGQRMPWRDILKSSLIFTAAFMLCTAPYFIVLKLQLGVWDVTSKTSAALKTQDGILTLTKDGKLPTVTGGMNPWVEHYKNIPNFLKSSADSFRQYFDQFRHSFPLWLHLLALAGLIMLALSAPWQALLLSILFLLTLPNYIVNISKTLSYLYSVFPLYFICCISAFELTGKAATRLFPGLRIGAVIAAAVMTLWFSVSSWSQAHEALDDPGLQNEALLTRHIFMDAAQYIRSIAQPGDVIMTRWGLVSYYSGMQTTSLPKGSVDDVLAFGKKSGATWLLIDSPSVFSRRQELEILLDPARAAAVLKQHGVTPVHVGGKEGLGIYVVYRFQ